MEPGALRVASSPDAAGGRLLRFGIPGGLLLLAAVGWWWSARMSTEMTPGMDGMGGMDAMDAPYAAMSLAAFVVAWVAMMAAMMLPGVLPVVQLYARTAAKGRAAPVPFLVAGYLAVWTVFAVPAYLAWRALAGPLAEGQPWAGRLAGATMLVAAVWQVTPLKSICLRHCRSPLSFFLRFGGGVARPTGAFRMGAAHGAFCLGCCWALFAVLVALGTMNLLWMVLFTVVILLEKYAPRGEQIARVVALALAACGTLLLVDPSMLIHLT
jgi:predicted metal-binding membrane protein